MRRFTFILNLLLVLFYLIGGSQSQAAGIVTPGTTQLEDSASSGSPAMWWLDSDYISPSSSQFIIGGSWNQLSIANGHDFTASAGLSVGTTNRSYNLLSVEAGNQVFVSGNAYCGRTTSIAYSSRHNRTVISGASARIDVTGSFQVGSGGAWLITDNYLTLSDGGTLVVDSDMDGTGGFGASNHWSYGNSWLELDGGLLAMYGDKTANYATGTGILSSIKVWDDVSGSFKRVAYYDYTTWTATQYLDLLSVEYILDSSHAASLGVSDEFVGFTVVQNIPEPATLSLLGLGTLAIIRRRNAS